VEATSGDAQRRAVCGDGWRRSGDRRRAGPRGLGRPGGWRKSGLVMGMMAAAAAVGMGSGGSGSGGGLKKNSK
jgi:hypothetical protein